MGLSETYDGDELFSFDFSQNTRVPRLPDFAEWAQEQGDASAIAFDKGFCELLMQKVSPVLEGQIPVSRGQGQGVSRGGAASLIPQTSHHLSLFPPPGSAWAFSSLFQHFSCQLQSVPCFVVGRTQPKALKSIELAAPLSVCILITMPCKTRDELVFQQEASVRCQPGYRQEVRAEGPPTQCPSCRFCWEDPSWNPKCPHPCVRSMSALPYTCLNPPNLPLLPGFPHNWKYPEYSWYLRLTLNITPAASLSGRSSTQYQVIVLSGFLFFLYLS